MSQTQDGRVTQAEVMEHGLDRASAHAERLAKENRELREEIKMLEEVIAGLKEKK